MRSLAVAAVLALTGCSSNPLSPSPPALSGTWRIDWIKRATQPFTVGLPPEVVYQLTFEGSRVSARVECNTCNGSFSMAGASLTIDPALACTRAACPHPSGASPSSPYTDLSNDVVLLLAGSHEITEDGDRPGFVGQPGSALEWRREITLLSSRGAMRLRRQ